MLTRTVIAGATGTGKTKTLQSLAEQFSAAGVPVFVADIKDLRPRDAGEAGDRAMGRRGRLALDGPGVL
jgi:DNA helicase HerA-like ATPase